MVKLSSRLSSHDLRFLWKEYNINNEAGEGVREGVLELPIV